MYYSKIFNQLAHCGILMLSLCLITVAHTPSLERSLQRRQECTIPANGDGSDDAPAILAAFKTCRSHGRIVFQNTTYHINSVMKTTDLVETDIQIKGKLLVSIKYNIRAAKY